MKLEPNCEHIEYDILVNIESLKVDLEKEASAIKVDLDKHTSDFEELEIFSFFFVFF